MTMTPVRAKTATMRPMAVHFSRHLGLMFTRDITTSNARGASRFTMPVMMILTKLTQDRSALVVSCGYSWKPARPPVRRPGRCAQTTVMVTGLLLAGRCRAELPMWMR